MKYLPVIIILLCVSASLMCGCIKSGEILEHHVESWYNGSDEANSTKIGDGFVHNDSVNQYRIIGRLKNREETLANYKIIFRLYDENNTMVDVKSIQKFDIPSKYEIEFSYNVERKHTKYFDRIVSYDIVTQSI